MCLLLKQSPLFGYYPNASKTRLLVKPANHVGADVAFAGTGGNITTERVQYLGAPFGNIDFTKCFVKEQVDKLSEFAQLQPHIAFCTLTQGLINRCTNLSRTVKDINSLMYPI